MAMESTGSVGLAFAAATDPGIVRIHNEDSIAVAPEVGLAVLADGMGGYNAGEVASSLATSQLKRELEHDVPHVDPSGEGSRSLLHQVIQARIRQVNQAIFDAARGDEQLTGMGTTLVLVVVGGGRITVAHVGDSRAYRLRAGKFMQLTRDHSLLQEQIDAGLLTASEARYSQNRNLVTRAVGVDPIVVAEIADFDTQAADIYLLCSDGLTDMVPDEQIAAVLASDMTLDECAAQLIDMANEAGGRDNVSVILVRVDSHAARPRSLMSKVRSWFA